LAVCLCWKDCGLRPLSLVALVLTALFVPALPFEILLRHLASQGADYRSANLSHAIAMPREWQKKSVKIPGTSWAYYWHGKLHVHNSDRMRLVGQFPPKRADTFRVMVLGDSLTYGQGIDQEDTYCRVLERDLGRKYRIEVLNLGCCGDQSEDVLKTLK